MKKIAVADIRDSMILARDVCRTSGNVLLSKGTALSAAMGHRLENWGITTVCIEGEEDIPQETNTVTVSFDQEKELLLDKFSNVMENPLMKKIFNAVLDFHRTRNSR